MERGATAREETNTWRSGAPNWNKKGRVYVYEYHKDDDMWNRRGAHFIDGQSLPWDASKNVECTQPSNMYGHSLTLKADGTIVLVGAPNDEYENGYRALSTRVYWCDGSLYEWNQQRRIHMGLSWPW